MPRTLDDFTDILIPRRHRTGTFMWASRELNFKVCYEQNVKPNPESHKRDVLMSQKIRSLVQKLSVEENLSVAAVESQVSAILDEIGYKKNVTLLRWLAIFLASICCKVCRSIFVNVGSINRLKLQMGKVPIVYVPNHKSYADFILMSYVLFTMDITIPAIAAGMDFHSMKGMGTVLRNTGAFFMRRSYNQDNLYWDTFREYVNQLVVRGDAGLEFFIEGMRSRSCKALPPKYGLLFMIAKAFFSGEVPDIQFVPVSISYDRMMEEKLFAFELMGVPKPKESTSAFFKSMSILKEQYGNIYIDFSVPISAREFFAGTTDRSQHAMKPLHTQELSIAEKAAIIKLAERIVLTQKQLSVVTTSNLLAAVLLNEAMRRRLTSDFDEVVSDVVWLDGVLRDCGAFTNLRDPVGDVRAALDVHKNLIACDDGSKVGVAREFYVSGNFDPARLKGHALSEQTMSRSLPFLMLQIYVNPALQYVINASLLVTIIKCYNTPLVSKASLIEEYKFLRHLYSNEFTLFNDNLFEDFDLNLRRLHEWDCIDVRDDVIVPKSNEKLQAFLLNMLKPFIVTYFALSSHLSHQSQVLVEKDILAATQERIEEVMNVDGSFVHPYCLSLDSMSLCLQSLVSLKALRKSFSKNVATYQVQTSVLEPIADRLCKYVDPHLLVLRRPSNLKNKM